MANVWTQGVEFSFKQGDVLYDTEEAYQVWSKALTEIGICISVKAATSASSWQIPPGGLPKRDPGKVEIAILRPNAEGNALQNVSTLSLTQDEFVRLLIIGDPKLG